jgi:hypothetical protein
MLMQYISFDNVPLKVAKNFVTAIDMSALGAERAYFLEQVCSRLGR